MSGGVRLTEFGALPALSIAAADGAEAIVTLYGAQLVAWRTADGRQRLFCGARAARDGGAAIRGGVPVIFPQFAARGDGPRHGFARTSHWRLSGAGRNGADHFAELSLTPAELPAALALAWPHAFALCLRVTLRADAVALSLSVRNTGAAPFRFAAALHAYYLVDALEQASLEGLQDRVFSEDAAAPARQAEPALRFEGKLDRVYRDAPGRLLLRTGAGALRLEQRHFTDAVVWNPGALDAAALADLDDQEYRRFVCVEPARLDAAPLAAGAVWRGELEISSIP